MYKTLGRDGLGEFSACRRPLFFLPVCCMSAAMRILKTFITLNTYHYENPGSYDSEGAGLATEACDLAHGANSFRFRCVVYIACVEVAVRRIMHLNRAACPAAGVVCENMSFASPNTPGTSRRKTRQTVMQRQAIQSQFTFMFDLMQIYFFLQLHRRRCGHMICEFCGFQGFSIPCTLASRRGRGELGQQQ